MSTSIDTHGIDEYVQSIMRDETMPVHDRAQHAALAIRNTVLIEHRLPLDAVLQIDEQQMAEAFERITQNDWLAALADGEPDVVEESTVEVTTWSGARIHEVTLVGPDDLATGEITLVERTTELPIIDLDEFDEDMNAAFKRIWED